ncbi:MAG: DUF1640 domain-containing protein [Magnetococcales bacterium]|nr:DUF1640 domain-containing protein [Magnetococcales bacterium]
MANVLFDTLKYARRLKEVGVPEPQAEVQAEMLAEALAERLASKEELAKTETALRADLAKTETALRADLAKTETALRADLAKTETALRAEVQEVRAEVQEVRAEVQEVRRDVKEMELRMVIKMGAMILGAVGILFGLMRTWPLSVQYAVPPGQAAVHTPLPSAVTPREDEH